MHWSLPESISTSCSFSSPLARLSMAAASATAVHRNQVDLSEFIDWSSVECLNQKFSPEDNQSGADTTKVQKIALFGTTVKTTDMKGLKKIEYH